MSENLICPVMSAGSSDYDVCIEERCAWWASKVKACFVKVIAASAASVALDVCFDEPVDEEARFWVTVKGQEVLDRETEFDLGAVASCGRGSRPLRDYVSD